jgi:hypothetical protein
MPAVAIAESDTIEGTWEEVVSQGAKLSGHRVRVVILPEEAKTTGRYATRIRPLLEEVAKVPPTPEERDKAEQEVEDMKNALNANRQRDGAEPIF